MRDFIILSLALLTLTVAAEPINTKMFNGKDLSGWNSMTNREYDLHGKVIVNNGVIEMEQGFPYSGIEWTEKFPKLNYRLMLRAKRTQYDDIFCGLFFPVGSNYCTLVLGGWGNNIVGLSCIDGMLACDNEAAVMMGFTNNTWYSVQLTVTEKKIQVRIDNKEVIDLDTIDRDISPYPGLEDLAPFSIFTFSSGAAFDEIEVVKIK